MPAQNTHSNAATGILSSDGRYRLRPAGSDIGFEPGRFQVFLNPPGAVPQSQPSSVSASQTDSRSPSLASSSAYSVPERFLSSQTSDIWVELDKEPTRVDIDLKD
jgi:hypothetical protein